MIQLKPKHQQWSVCVHTCIWAHGFILVFMIDMWMEVCVCMGGGRGVGGITHTSNLTHINTTVTCIITDTHTPQITPLIHETISPVHHRRLILLVFFACRQSLEVNTLPTLHLRPDRHCYCLWLEMILQSHVRALGTVVIVYSYCNADESLRWSPALEASVFLAYIDTWNV